MAYRASHQLPLFFPSLLVKFLCDNGHNQQRLLQGTNLLASDLVSPHTRVTLEQVYRLIRNCEQAWGQAGLSLEFGRSLPLQSLGMIGQAASSSETLGSALQAIVRYLSLRDPLQSYSIEQTDRGLCLRHTKSIKDPTLYRFISEAACAAQISFAEQLTGAALNGFEFFFDFQVLGEAQLYQQVLGNNLHFDSDSFWIFVPDELLQQKLPSANPMTAAEARLFCERELEQHGPVSGLQAVVQTLLRSRISEPPTEKQAGVILGYSDRNLRRQLALEGTSYRALLIEVRQQEGKRQLEHTSHTIEQIAAALGYENVGNFCRAFKRWTGLTPTQYRRQNI